MSALITDEMLDTYAIAGSYDDIAGKIKARYTGLLDRASRYRHAQPSLDDPRWPALVRAFNQ